MFKRLLLCLVLALMLSGPGGMKARAVSPYTNYVLSYLNTGLIYAQNAYASSTPANSTEAYYAYFYGLYAKYYATLSSYLSQNPGNSGLDPFAYYTFLYSFYSQKFGLDSYLKSSGLGAPTAYYSYFYNYYAYIYSYYAYVLQ
jgi:hypothetical protein